MTQQEIDAMEVDDFEVSDTYVAVYDLPDELMRAEILAKMRRRAVELKCATTFDNFVRTFNRLFKQAQREERERQRNNNTAVVVNNHTNFKDAEGSDMHWPCGVWIATESGVEIDTERGTFIACPHPIYPKARLKNLETGEEHVVLAFKRRGKWQELTIKKSVVSSANKIVALSDYGIAVTSENAKYLVRYLSDVEAYNDFEIGETLSTSKLGWHGADFIPYDTEILFDGNSRFKSLFAAIRSEGSWQTWLDHVKKIRQRGRIEVAMLMAASFSSVLIPIIGNLPFFVDLFGETEGGKTVTEMVAASIWADPKDAAYIGDLKTTDTALEARADMLNNLPMILDDTSKTSDRVRNNFEGIVYDLCSGKGKTRSNKELGINRENHWSCCFITNGERPLSYYVNQGGAINRILEVECMPDVFENPAETAETVKKNFGFAGKLFVEHIKTMPRDSIMDIFNKFRTDLADASAMQKQIDSLAAVLTADRIATDAVFKDGIYISLDDARKCLISHSELSDNQRCYEYLVDKVAMNPARFDLATNIEHWGIASEHGDYAIFFNQAFTSVCGEGNYSRKSFLNWAERKGLIVTDGKNQTKQKKIAGKNCRCVWLVLPQEDEWSVTDDLDVLPFD